jgi:hypothetical protein
MDTTDHGHIPYVYILVRALEDWKAAVCHPPPRRVSAAYAGCLHTAQRTAASDLRREARIQVQAKCTKAYTGRRKFRGGTSSGLSRMDPDGCSA